MLGWLTRPSRRAELDLLAARLSERVVEHGRDMFVEGYVGGLEARGLRDPAKREHIRTQMRAMFRAYGLADTLAWAAFVVKASPLWFESEEEERA